MSTYPLAMFESPIQIAVVLVLALLVFGPKKMPEIGKQLGTGIRELKKGLGGGFSFDDDETTSPASRYDDPPAFPEARRQALPQVPATPDLTDYTIAEPREHAVAKRSEGEYV